MGMYRPAMAAVPTFKLAPMEATMRHSLIRTGLACTLAVAGGIALGCSNRTEGERTLERAERHEEAGAMIRRGELMVQDGTALEARGGTLKQQGDDLQGDKLVAEGRAKQAQGRELIEEGRKMKP
jgi:hypothetical protein